MESDEKHKCIISCEICLKEHREILNRIDRVLEFLEGDVIYTGKFLKDYIKKVLKGESH